VVSTSWWTKSWQWPDAVSSQPDNPFWRFSLAHYDREDVARACLSLQDQWGANVNLILFCCWLGARGERLGRAQLEEAGGQIDEWDRRVVKPLRQVRSYLRQSPMATEAMARDALGLELSAEHVVQDVLATWWLEKKLPGEAVPAVAAAALARDNLSLYLGFLGAPPPAEDSPLLWPILAPPSPR